MIDEPKDRITYEREYLEPLIKENLDFLSPPNNSLYEVGDSIETTNDTTLDKYKIAVELETKNIEQYRYRKYINGVPSEPPEYSNNGVIYNGQTSTTKKILKDSEYEITITE